MTTAERNDKINAIIADALCVDITEVTPTATLRDDLGADSMDMSGLAIELESAFDFEMKDSDGDGLVMVRDVYELVGRKVTQ